jgi:hypothetical protein
MTRASEMSGKSQSDATLHRARQWGETARAAAYRDGTVTNRMQRGRWVEQPGQVRARQSERVRAGGVEFFVEVADGGGPQPVGLDRMLSFDGVRDTVEAIAGELAQVWDRVQPAEASVEFGLSLTAKAGKLTGLLVDGDGSASLKVTLTWKAAGAV